MLGPEAGEVGVGGAAQHAAFPCVDRVVALDEGGGGARFHFDKDEHRAVEADEVELVASVARAAPVAREDAEVFPTLEPARGKAFAACAERIGATETAPPG